MLDGKYPDYFYIGQFSREVSNLFQIWSVRENQFKNVSLDTTGLTDSYLINNVIISTYRDMLH